MPVSPAQAVAWGNRAGKVLTVHKKLTSTARRTGESPQSLYDKTAPKLKPIRETVLDAATHYVTEHFERHCSAAGRNGKPLRNASGVTFYGRTADTHDERAAAMCHLLQGTEAAVGHALISIQEKYNYRVLLHEHDGVVTEGIIPPSAVQEALRLVSEAAGFDVTDLELVLKPYHKKRASHWAHATHSTTLEETKTTTESPWSWSRERYLSYVADRTPNRRPRSRTVSYGRHIRFWSGSAASVR